MPHPPAPCRRAAAALLAAACGAAPAGGATPSPTSSTPAPTAQGVSGDPFTSFAGKTTQFYLPVREMTPLLSCGGVELAGRARGSGVPGDEQQWFDAFRLRVAGGDAVTVAVANATRLLFPAAAPGAAARRDDDDGGVDIDAARGGGVAAALARLRAAAAGAGARALTTLAVTAEGAVVPATGSKLVAGGKMNVTVAQDRSKPIGSGYVEIVEVETEDLSMHMESSVAGKFASATDCIKNTHIDMSFTKLTNIPCLSGMLPEIWGIKPMSSSTAKVLIPPSKIGKLV